MTTVSTASPMRSSPGSEALAGARRPVAAILAATLAWTVTGHTSLSAQASEARGPRPVRLEVMTFNIRTAAGRDGANQWEHRKELVAETIALSDPDVVGLQEALAEQIDYLEERLSEYRWVGVDRGLNGGVGLSEATPIFYRYRALVPIESGTFWLSDTPDRPRAGRRVSRIVTWARFHHLESGRQIHVYNTHFTLRRGRRQIESAARINERIARLPAGSPVVVMGDFNAVAGASETWRAATSGGLRDAWLLAPDRRGPPVTSGGFGPPPESRERRIDWVLVGGDISVTRAATIVHAVAGRYPSDHYPVVATLLVGGG